MKRRWIITIAVIIIVGAGLILWSGRSTERAWVSFLQGDPGRGGRIFFDKGCIHCHAISGTGGKTASDLGKTPQIHLTLTQLVGVMWNHAPQMWKSIEEAGIRFPEITEHEMVDVFAYLYIARYLDEPGDLERGKQLLTQKGCNQCHSLYGEAGTIGPDLRQWGRSDHPIIWACAMWNHAPAMEKMMKEKGISWPEFQGNEMVDLLYYIRSASHEPRKSIDLFPADPSRGEDLFSIKGCVHCHAIHGRGGTTGPDLGEPTSFSRTPTQLAGSMWNHSPRMWEAMKEKKISRPQFSEVEMADLTAYLYAVRYFDEPGDTTAGHAIFAGKRCDHCHKEEKRTIGPSIGRWRGHLSPVTMAYIMWRHGPKMFAKMKATNTPWPLFEGREMVDLIAYLNRK
jgi:cytochrome c551/c552